MNLYTRRRLLSHLAIASASSCLYSGCKEASPDSVRHAASQKQPIYMIVQGPWLFSIEGEKLVAHTIDPGVGNHQYTFYDPRNGSIANPLHKVSPGEDLSFTVSRTNSPTPGTTKRLLSQMRNRSEGLFFNTNVSLNHSSTDSSHRSVTLDAPDEILSAGIISDVGFVLNNATVNGSVLGWPAAYVLIYHDCDGGNLNGSTSYDSFQTGSSITYRKFDIYHKPMAHTCREDSDHATEYFKHLMALLSFPGGNLPPYPQFPCPKYPRITLGGDLNIKCTDIDPDPSSWCPPGKRDNKGPSLVNCASGHGGVVGCC